MIAGSNGAGKTTMAKALIPSFPSLYEFINADEIAKGLAPLRPETMALTASKLMIKRFKELLESNNSFAFETTGSGTNYIKHLQQAKKQGYTIELFYLWLQGPDQAVQRVMQRVSQGGHHIPKEVVIRRYFGGLRNVINQYLPLADNVLIVDNSLQDCPKIIAEKILLSALKILEPNSWDKILEIAHEQ